MNIEVRKILELINNYNYECYIVGGYIRDYILGINSKDYDELKTSISVKLPRGKHQRSV